MKKQKILFEYIQKFKRINKLAKQHSRDYYSNSRNISNKIELINEAKQIYNNTQENSNRSNCKNNYKQSEISNINILFWGKMPRKSFHSSRLEENPQKIADIQSNKVALCNHKFKTKSNVVPITISLPSARTNNIVNQN